MGGPNSASATFIPDYKPSLVPGMEISEFGKKDEDSKITKERCTTPVTVTHFSLNEKNGVVERIILPNSNLLSEEKSINVKTTEMDLEVSGDNAPDLLIADSSNPESRLSLLDKNTHVVTAESSSINRAKDAKTTNIPYNNNPFSNPFKSESFSRSLSSNPFQDDSKNPFLDSSNPFVGSQSTAKDALSCLTEDVKTQMEILSKDISKKVFL